MATSSSIDARLPERGDVIEFSFLWKHESQAGQVEGAKDRRCVVVSVLSGGRRVVVAPITGTEPAHANKLPLSGGALGLVRNSWIVTSELNVTSWPGHDLRPARSPMGAWWRYGRISDALRTRLADVVETLVKTNQANVTLRT
jgi:mRNA-degrading endonuclease toxin of MazEF toxin-antitoxin module